MAPDNLQGAGTQRKSWHKLSCCCRFRQSLYRYEQDHIRRRERSHL